MGEEAKKEEEPKVEAKAEEKKEEEKKEEEKKTEEPKAEEKKEEEKKTEEPPAPPPPVILQVDLHCVGCARKIERCILKCKGVEGVEVEMAKNLVTVKGIVDPEAVCSRIQKKTMRKAKIISPVLPARPADQADGAAIKPQMVLSQVSEATTIELKVNMHCEACAQQLQKKIKKMRGVQNVETNLGAAQVKVTGTMTGEKLVEYIYRRTGKLATIIPPPPPPEEKKEESDKKPKENPAEEKKEEKVEEKKDEEKPAEEGKEKSEEEKKESNGKEEKGAEDPKKEGEIVVATNNAIWHGGYMNHGFPNGGYMNPGFMNPGFMNGGYANHEEEMTKRSMMMNWMPTMPAMAMPVPMHMPVYMIEPPPPPPRMFSDENPNACVIS